MADPSALEHLTAIVAGGIASGKAVEIDGLGTFYPDPSAVLRFEPCTKPQAFIAYAREDSEIAGRLFDQLDAAGFNPWMDSRKLLPGQNWPRALENAIEVSDFFIACFSHTSATRRGGFQAEVRYALDCARHSPLDEVFILPVRLDQCRVPRTIQREIQYVDLFPDWEKGFRRLVKTLQSEWTRRREA